MKRWTITFLASFCTVFSAWADPEKDFYSFLHETRGAVQKTFKDRPIFSEKGFLELEGLPPIPLTLEVGPNKTGKILGREVEIFPLRLSAEAAEALLPLNEAEAEMSRRLESFGINALELAGEGRRWSDPQSGEILAEALRLEGFMERKGERIPWRIDFARARRGGQ